MCRSQGAIDDDAFADLKMENDMMCMMQLRWSWVGDGKAWDGVETATTKICLVTLRPAARVGTAVRRIPVAMQQPSYDKSEVGKVD